MIEEEEEENEEREEEAPSKRKGKKVRAPERSTTDVIVA